MPHTIVVGVDFSPCSLEAAHLALADLHGTGGTIILVHASAFLVPPSWDVPLETIRAARRVHDDVVARRLARIADQLRNEASRRDWSIVIATEIVAVPAADALIRRAWQTGASAIVVGAHGKSRASTPYLGSVAERLLRASGGPVLVVKPAPQQEHNHAGRVVR